VKGIKEEVSPKKSPEKNAGFGIITTFHLPRMVVPESFGFVEGDVLLCAMVNRY